MKALRDTNNNNSSTTSTHFLSNSSRQNLGTMNAMLSQDLNTTSINSNIQQGTSSSPLNPFASAFHVDVNQLSSTIHSYLSKINRTQLPQLDPLFYLQYLQNNPILMQQLTSMQNMILSTQNDLTPQQSTNSNPDAPTEAMNVGRYPHSLQGSAQVFVPKIHSMSQDDIAEHTRLVYQRAVQRNQLQQNNDLMKHFYETLNTKVAPKQSSPMRSTNSQEVPGVPNVSNIVSIGTFDVVDTMITSSSSCFLTQESDINAALSSVSLLSADDTKLHSNASSILDPSAPIFIPRQSRLNLDEDNETSSSSSDSDFNDFHYVDQFLGEFYNSANEHDNHIVLPKVSSTDLMPNKYPMPSNSHGQGDVIDESTAADKQNCQYSIHDLLNRYRNPRSHLVLPEWSRLSLILPNVCTMRAHTYKIKRYFAYRRRLYEDRNVNKTSDEPVSVQA
ncbi:unnamed protein product [Adineta ricciae]|uniref:Uncharacterized protein n=1 Tax=Adineta ricciae TaxID=249248 RepID=A0A814AAE4_ADIRI|nr:unnamed protein product [Adineta ricciae]